MLREREGLSAVEVLAVSISCDAFARHFLLPENAHRFGVNLWNFGICASEQEWTRNADSLLVFQFKQYEARKRLPRFQFQQTLKTENRTQLAESH
jgi:hypothetical protein